MNDLLWLRITMLIPFGIAVCASIEEARRLKDITHGRVPELPASVFARVKQLQMIAAALQAVGYILFYFVVLFHMHRHLAVIAVLLLVFVIYSILLLSARRSLRRNGLSLSEFHRRALKAD